MKIGAILFITLISGVLHAAEPFCVAHRSLGFGGLENSLEAFQNASENKASAIEFDINHTADHKSIIYHDKKLKRLGVGENCPLKEKIAELSLDQIRSNCHLKNGEAIPLFEEGLDVLSRGNALLFIEFKDAIITRADIETIKRYYMDRPEKVAIISFHTEVLKTVKNWAQTDEFLKKVRTVRLKKFGFFGGTESADLLSTKYIHSTRAKRLRDSGMLVGAYTKDSEARINKYLDKGLDFITTNNSQLCEDIISKRK